MPPLDNEGLPEKILSFIIFVVMVPIALVLMFIFGEKKE